MVMMMNDDTFVDHDFQNLSHSIFLFVNSVWHLVALIQIGLNGLPRVTDYPSWHQSGIQSFGAVKTPFKDQLSQLSSSLGTNLVYNCTTKFKRGDNSWLVIQL